MLKKLLYSFLATLLLPIGVLISTLIVSLLLISFLLASPLVVAVYAVKLGSYLSSILVNFFFSEENSTQKYLTILLAPSLIAVATFIPMALVVYTLAAIIVPLSFIALSLIASFGLAMKIVDESYSFIEKRLEYTPLKENSELVEYGILPPEDIRGSAPYLEQRNNPFPIISSEADAEAERSENEEDEDVKFACQYP